MATMQVPLWESAEAVFDDDGNASVFMGPSRAGQSWHVTRYVSSCTDTGNLGITFALYRNGSTPANQIDNTYTGVNATADTVLDVPEGGRLLGVWTGGTPGTYASLNLTGQVNT